MTAVLLGILPALGIVLELDLDGLAIDHTLIEPQSLHFYSFTHSAAEALSFISTKAKQYSELRLRLTTRLSTLPHFSNKRLNSSSNSRISACLKIPLPDRSSS